MMILLVAGIAAGGQVMYASFALDVALVILIEALIAANLIPTIRKVRHLFLHLPLDLRILSDGGKQIYQTNIARKLDDATLRKLDRAKEDIDDGSGGGGGTSSTSSTSSSSGGKNSASANTSSSGVTSIRLSPEDDGVFRLFRLSAGTAVLFERIDELNELQRRLERKHDKLVQQNNTLRQQHELQNALYAKRRERELSERVERDLATTMAHIRTILDNLVENGDAIADDERLQQLNLVKVLVAYSKRKGMLALASMDSDVVPLEQFGAISREAMADLRSVGVECAVLTADGRDLPIDVINEAYDCFYECIISILPRVNPFVMVFIDRIDERSIELRVSVECGIGLGYETAAENIPPRATDVEPLSAVQEEISQNIDERLAKHDIDYSVGLVDGRVSVVTRISGERP